MGELPEFYTPESKCARSDDCTLSPGHPGRCLPYAQPTVLSGDIQNSTVDIPWIKEGLSVGPDEVLVISIEAHYSPAELRPLLEHLDRILGPTRYVIVSGMNARVAKVHRGQTGDDNAVLRASMPTRELRAS